MWLIGDIHGEFDWYIKQVSRGPVDCSIQLGDFGWGFSPVYNRRRQLIQKWSHMQDLSYVPEMPQHKFICGNHDDRMLAKKHPNYLGDFGFVPSAGLFYISGGFSHDWQRRKPGIEWWACEELTQTELDRMIECHADARPSIVVSHEAPAAVVAAMYPYEKHTVTSRTAAALAKAFEAWEPDYWYFGHYHWTRHLRVGKTRFQCIGELQRIELRGVTW